MKIITRFLSPHHRPQSHLSHSALQLITIVEPFRRPQFLPVGYQSYEEERRVDRWLWDSRTLNAPSSQTKQSQTCRHNAEAIQQIAIQQLRIHIYCVKQGQISIIMHSVCRSDHLNQRIVVRAKLFALWGFGLVLNLSDYVYIYIRVNVIVV